MSSQVEMAVMGRDCDPLLDFESAGYFPFCRICFETHGYELISPCMCKGTQQFVHRSCLDHWRSVKEGFAFSHCTTCRVQFHLEIADCSSWRKTKYKFFVARDILIVLLAVQTVIAALGGITYLMYRSGSFINSFKDTPQPPEHLVAKYPISFFYSMGVVCFILLMGIIQLISHCSTLASNDRRIAGCQNGCLGCWMLDCFPAAMHVWIGIITIVFLVFIAILGLSYILFAMSLLFQRICQRHYDIMARKELTKEYVVMDLRGRYTPPRLDPVHEERLRMLYLM